MIFLFLAFFSDADAAQIRCPRGAHRVSRKDGVACRRWFSERNHGPRITHHPRGSAWKMKSEEHFVDGVPHGRWTQWYPDGQVRSVGTYRAGTQVGLWREWNPDGSPRWFRTYDRDGRLHGDEQRWHVTGEPSGVAEFVHGQHVGTWQRWRADGLLILHEEFDRCGRLVSLPVDGHRHGLHPDAHRVDPAPEELLSCAP